MKAVPLEPLRPWQWLGAALMLVSIWGLGQRIDPGAKVATH